MLLPMNARRFCLAGITVIGVALAGCGSTSTNSSASTGASGTTVASAATGSSGTSLAPASPTTAATATAAVCPTMAQADAALGASDTGPTMHAAGGGGIVCEYTGSNGIAGVTIFSQQSATVFAGQVAHAPGNPAMPALSGVGDGAYGQTAGGRSVVNAYSNATHTLVAAQAPGAIAPVEALAQVALSDN